MNDRNKLDLYANSVDAVANDTECIFDFILETPVRVMDGENEKERVVRLRVPTKLAFAMGDMLTRMKGDVKDGTD